MTASCAPRSSACRASVRCVVRLAGAVALRVLRGAAQAQTGAAISRADGAGQRLRRGRRCAERRADRADDPRAAGGQRRRRRRRHRADDRAVRRHPRIRREAVRERRARHRRERQGQRPAHPRSPLKERRVWVEVGYATRAVRHRRLRRPDEPRGDDARVPRRAATAGAARRARTRSSGASRRAGTSSSTACRRSRGRPAQRATRQCPLAGSSS